MRGAWRIAYDPSNSRNQRRAADLGNVVDGIQRCAATLGSVGGGATARDCHELILCEGLWVGGVGVIGHCRRPFDLIALFFVHSNFPRQKLGKDVEVEWRVARGPVVEGERHEEGAPARANAPSMVCSLSVCPSQLPLNVSVRVLLSVVVEVRALDVFTTKPISQ